MLKIGSIVFAMAASASCLAQESASPAASTTPPPLAAADQLQPAATNECCRIVDGTPVTLEILDLLNSSLLKRGDKFKLRLASPLMINDRTVLASGVEGVGEVIHAEKSRGGGKAGELLIAARYLDHHGLQVRLRGLKVGGRGKDNTGAALATAMAVGMFAYFVQGGEVEIPAGTLAQAKIAQDIELQPIGQMQGGPVPAAAPMAANAAIPNPSLSQTGDSASPATTETPTPQQPVVETTQEPKE